MPPTDRSTTAHRPSCLNASSSYQNESEAAAASAQHPSYQSRVPIRLSIVAALYHSKMHHDARHRSSSTHKKPDHRPWHYATSSSAMAMFASIRGLLLCLHLLMVMSIAPHCRLQARIPSRKPPTRLDSQPSTWYPMPWEMVDARPWQPCVAAFTESTRASLRLLLLQINNNNKHPIVNAIQHLSLSAKSP